MQRSRAVDRLESALARCHNVAEVASAVFTGLAPIVPFSFGCLATTDPMTGLITRAYKSKPLEIGDEEFTRAEYGAPDLNQFAEIAARPLPIGVLSVDTGGRPELCARFRDFMAPRFGFTDEIRMSCPAHGLTWGALAVYRSTGQPAFTAADADLLAPTRGVIAEALRRTLFSPEPAADAALPEPAVVIVDDRGQARQMTRAARDRIEDLGGRDNGALPAGLLAVAAHARATAGVVATRTRLSSGRWLTLRGSALEGPGADVVVTIDLARPGDLNQLTLLARGLTVREQEVVGLMMKGASTKAISAALHLSPHTVQDHCKSIFGKLGVNSRRELITQLLD